MKKIILALLVVVLIVSMCACGEANTSTKKTPLTSEEFTKILEDKGYIVKDLEVVPHNDFITDAKGTTDQDKNLKVQYYRCSVEKETKKLYKNVFDNTKVLPTSALERYTDEGENWTYLTSSDKGTYHIAMRIDDTLISGSCKEEYKEELIVLFKNLGYWVEPQPEDKK